MKSRWIACIILLVLLSAANADAGAAKYGGEFLSTGIGARALGMGGAFVAIADDASASYWNPAGMIYVGRREIVLMHSERFGDIVNYDAGGFVQQLGTSNSKRKAFGVSFLRVGVSDIVYTAEDPASGRIIADREVSSAEWGFALSYAKLLNNVTSLGGSIKLVRKSIGDDSGAGFGFDVGAMFKPWRRLAVGVTLQDATTTFLVWDQTTENIYPTGRVGVAYPFLFPSLKGRLNASFQVDGRFEGRKTATAYWVGSASADLRYGLEYWYDSKIAVRFGMEQHEKVDQMAGAGLRLPLGNTTLGLDYAFLSNAFNLDDTHRVSGSLIF